MEIVKILNGEIKNWTKKCLKNKLYSPKGQMSFLYKHPHYITNLIVAIKDEQIVGVAIEGEDDLCNIYVFVKPDFRRQGIGTKLVKQLDLTNKTYFKSPLNERFWNSLKEVM